MSRQIEDHVLFDGHFAITSHPDPLYRTLDGMFQAMRTNRSYLADKAKRDPRYMQIGGNAQGYRRGSKAYNDIISASLRCALKEECIAPEKATVLVHRFDQSATSVAMLLGGYFPIADHRFNAYQSNDPYITPYPDGREPNQVVTLLTRRGGDGVFASRLKRCT